ncbi:uncharacterized protein BT62DRAFT_185050 [Guyanagaster necrorhizus]|uniref:Uncharacterized protein n=1 Tax=Guyanagaster necrorhizus TaxID=856835 RepID=A0A9P7VRQ1_9AGAR|nr:uncharacterized protein BT62DRAFT_185050 [Guyanagaster necrorhizus MCA 3950]KAG7445245.1 hypothetical protein BT62DRAFT_185050 [Guyanagaster necrorhizus MCA 3950]
MVNFGWYFDINQDKIDLEDVVRNGQTGPNNLSSLSPSATLNTPVVASRYGTVCSGPVGRPEETFGLLYSLASMSSDFDIQHRISLWEQMRKRTRMVPRFWHFKESLLHQSGFDEMVVDFWISFDTSLNANDGLGCILHFGCDTPLRMRYDKTILLKRIVLNDNGLRYSCNYLVAAQWSFRMTIARNISNSEHG